MSDYERLVTWLKGSQMLAPESVWILSCISKCCSGLVQQLFDPEQAVCVFRVEGVVYVLLSLVFSLLERTD